MVCRTCQMPLGELHRGGCPRAHNLTDRVAAVDISAVAISTDRSAVSAFEDRTPVRVSFETDRGALAALKDNPLLLSEDVEGSFFANAVRRGIRHLRAAEVTEGD